MHASTPFLKHPTFSSVPYRYLSLEIVDQLPFLNPLHPSRIPPTDIFPLRLVPLSSSSPSFSTTTTSGSHSTRNYSISMNRNPDSYFRSIIQHHWGCPHVDWLYFPLTTCTLRLHVISGAAEVDNKDDDGKDDGS